MYHKPKATKEQQEEAQRKAIDEALTGRKKPPNKSIIKRLQKEALQRIHRLER